MRFFLTYKGEPKPPTAEQMAAIGKLGDEMKRTGVLIATGGILPASKEGRFTLKNGQFSLTDGPFTETHELIVGYAIVEARSEAEAIELGKRFMRAAGDGDAEVRRMVGENEHSH